MDRSRLNDHIAMPIIVSLLYIIYFYAATKFVIEHNILISINNVTINNVGIKFIDDFFAMLLFPLILTVINRKRLIEFKLQFRHTHLQYVLISIMILFFLLHKDFTIRGYYMFFFYLVVIGFAEEFIFRGYLYCELLRHNKFLAIIMSGFFWGILHAILPGLLVGDGLGQVGISMLSQIGGGIVMGYFFIYLLEKSKSLFVPVFVHSILDYSVGSFGIIIAIGTGVYLFIRDRKKLHKSL